MTQSRRREAGRRAGKRGAPPTKNVVAGPPPPVSEDPLLTAIQLQQQGRVAEAERLFRQILKVAPSHPAVLYSLAVILLNAGKPAEALEFATAEVDANPSFAPLALVQAGALQALQRRDEALAAYDRALQINPKYLEAMVNSGALLREMHRHHDALQRFRGALEVDPNHQSALGNYGILLTEFKLGPQAVATFEHLLKQNPDYPYGLGLLCFERLHLCDWTDLESTTHRITAGIRVGKKICKSLGYMAISDSAADHERCSRIFSEGQYPKRPAPLWRGEAYGHKRLRIAYVSPDLREHPVGHLMAGVIEGHDKTRFETIAISLGIDDKSRIRARMMSAFDHFIDARQMTSLHIAETMRQMEVDIAIDLAGYTSDARPDIFLHRPAPIQVNYLGYPGTMALEPYDYIIADRTVLPEEHQAWYSETPAYLDHCYLPIASGVEVAEPQPRSAYGLPDQGFVFCAFSHDYKIHPQVFVVWMRLLVANPGSVLWLVSRNEFSQRNLRQAAEQQGVDPRRLVFASRVPKIEDHLARYRVANLFLDTWPYNAHTTAADALLAGLPVVTYQGGAFPSRVAASLLKTLGFDELVSHSLEDYFALADGLAKDPCRLQALRDRLTPESLRGHPFLGASFTLSLEKVLLSMVPRGGTAEQSNTPQEAPPVAEGQQPLLSTTTQSSTALVDVSAAEPLNTAWALFHQGNLPQSELITRQHLTRAPGDPEALHLLDHLRQGYDISDTFELSERVSRPAAEPRYLLIKAWGYGFWSEGHHVASQLLLAELTGRIPVVHWGENCLFRRAGDKNTFGHFFQLPSPVEIDDLPKDVTIYPPKWDSGNLHAENVNKWEGLHSRLAAQYLFDRPETLLISDFYTTLSSILPWIGRSSRYHGMTEDEVYAELFQRYLQPVPRIKAIAEQFATTRMRGRPWVAVHARGSDKINESPRLPQTNASYFAFVDRIIELNPTIGVFLLTDSEPLKAEFGARYGGRMLCTDAARSTSSVGVHMSGQDGVTVGEEVFVDALLATRAHYFVGNKESNVSLAIASLKTWSKGFIFLLGEKSVRSDNLFLHQRQPVESNLCRLCGSPVKPTLSRKTSSRTAFDHHECTVCGSLQTEARNGAEKRAETETSIAGDHASRILSHFFALPSLFTALGIRPSDRCVEYGRGAGLFARMMRDIGYNFFRCDPCGSGDLYGLESWDALDRPCFLVAIIDGAERFCHPVQQWQAIVRSSADYIVVAPRLYEGQGAEWAESAFYRGDRMFFHSARAFAVIAAQHGWHAYQVGGYFLLSRARLSTEVRGELGVWNQGLEEHRQAIFQRWLTAHSDHSAQYARQRRQRARLREHRTRIAVDGVFFRYATGISRVWKSLLAEWSANGFGEFLLVIDRARTAPRFPGISYVDAPAHNYADRPGDRRLLQEICDLEGITLFTSTYYSTPTTTPTTLLVHDMIPEVMGFDLTTEQWREKHEALHYCSHFVAISESTANDLTAYFPNVKRDQVVIAHNGTSFRTPSSDQIHQFKKKFGISRPYFLISGVKSGYKNAKLFFEAFAQWGLRRAEYAIVCTNSPPQLDPDLAEFVGDAMVHLLVLSDEDLQCAYAGAVALAYPSRYEGFGLPILEAMACSCPVITCNNSSLREVAGDTALYVDPDDVEGMRQKLDLVQEVNVRARMIEQGLMRAASFSWCRMADTMERVWTDVVFREGLKK